MGHSTARGNAAEFVKLQAAERDPVIKARGKAKPPVDGSGNFVDRNSAAGRVKGTRKRDCPLQRVGKRVVERGVLTRRDDLSHRSDTQIGNSCFRRYWAGVFTCTDNPDRWVGLAAMANELVAHVGQGSARAKAIFLVIREEKTGEARSVKQWEGQGGAGRGSVEGACGPRGFMGRVFGKKGFHLGKSLMTPIANGDKKASSETIRPGGPQRMVAKSTCGKHAPRPNAALVLSKTNAGNEG